MHQNYYALCMLPNFFLLMRGFTSVFNTKIFLKQNVYLKC
jgi:hypothetical protein